MSEEKPKEGVKTENDHINLKVAGQDGSVVQFKIKRHTPLSKLMKAYCERQVRWRWRMKTPSTCSSSRREACGRPAACWVWPL
ncbi:small ubiquitin-related modifier 3 isoform 2, partial [Daubentonia madagascariensis]